MFWLLFILQQGDVIPRPIFGGFFLPESSYDWKRSVRNSWDIPYEWMDMRGAGEMPLDSLEEL